MSQIKLSDIKVARHGYEIDYLLDLVERLGKVLEEYSDHTESCAALDKPGLEQDDISCNCGYRKARTLLLEIKE